MDSAESTRLSVENRIATDSYGYVRVNEFAAYDDQPEHGAECALT